MKKKKTVKKDRGINTLLKILKEKAMEYNYRCGLCTYAQWLREDKKITASEKNKLMKFIRANKPDDYEQHLPWYFRNHIARRNWLLGHIKD